MKSRSFADVAIAQAQVEISQCSDLIEKEIGEFADGLEQLGNNVSMREYAIALEQLRTFEARTRLMRLHIQRLANAQKIMLSATGHMIALPISNFADIVNR